MTRDNSANWSISLFSVLVSAIVISCATRIYGPDKGITDKFFYRSNGEILHVNDYDFNRLNKNKGLLVFSYEIIGGWKDDSVKSVREAESGLRVWEHTFSGKERDKIYVTDTFLVWGRPSVLALGMSVYGYAVVTESRFHRGRIVYGGRLQVDMATFAQEGPSVKFHYNEDFVPWLEKYEAQVNGIGIDTVLIHAEAYR